MASVIILPFKMKNSKKGTVQNSLLQRNIFVFSSLKSQFNFTYTHFLIPGFAATAK
tara:strand:- start:1417 stop:1584 length:168 start_codon:yes stop_codon:yes gene_type:complete